MELEIIKDDPNYLIINKPAGLIVHGGKGINEKTLVDYLLEKYPELEKVGEDLERPAIVHRLDKEASGLMIIPKNNKSFEYFKKQFKERKMIKEYSALVFGKLSKENDIIDFPIKRSSQGHKMASIPKSNKNIKSPEDINDSTSNRAVGNLKALEGSRDAISEFNIIKRFINFSLVKVNIKTGRTHQIRVHFSAYGHPILGDNLYGNKKSKIKNKKMGINRLFLIANKLKFIDQDGLSQEFSINLSPDLEEILKIIK